VKLDVTGARATVPDSVQILVVEDEGCEISQLRGLREASDCRHVLPLLELRDPSDPQGQALAIDAVSDARCREDCDFRSASGQEFDDDIASAEPATLGRLESDSGMKEGGWGIWCRGLRPRKCVGRQEKHHQRG
jgi:hypothetical protein